MPNGDGYIPGGATREHHATWCKLVGEKELPVAKYYKEKSTGKIYRADEYYDTALSPHEMIPVDIKKPKKGKKNG
ncbi:MAG: hypothetical protein PHO67_08455 [Candidatus Omnitrophica bacterium]|nr:hypothetical protein [Candidatus Omnitrophota bacterium]